MSTKEEPQFRWARVEVATVEEIEKKERRENERLRKCKSVCSKCSYTIKISDENGLPLNIMCIDIDCSNVFLLPNKCACDYCNKDDE